MVIGVIAFIAYPLFSAPHGNIAEMPDALEALYSQRDSTYDAIRDLDFDFQLGKLSESDYTSLREKNKARAAETLKQIDALGGNGNHAEAEAQIENEVARLRRAKADAIEAEVAQLRRAKVDVIESEVAQLRRAKNDAVEAEIARVRAAKKSGERRCANCGTPFQSGDQFCAKCGNKL